METWKLELPEGMEMPEGKWSVTTGGAIISGIPVEISVSDGYWFVTDGIINMYGGGYTRQAAIDEYKDTVREYQEELEQSEAQLGDNLKQHLAYLRQRAITIGAIYKDIETGGTTYGEGEDCETTAECPVCEKWTFAGWGYWSDIEDFSCENCKTRFKIITDGFGVDLEVIA